jgi:hypothetical protein
MAIGKATIIFIGFSVFALCLSSFAAVAMTDRPVSTNYGVGNTINATGNATTMIIGSVPGMMQPMSLVLAILLFGAVISIYLVVVRRKG